MLDLAVLARRLRVNGCALRLLNPQPSVRTVIGMVGLHRLPGVRLEAGMEPAADDAADEELAAGEEIEAGEEIAAGMEIEAGATALAY